MRAILIVAIRSAAGYIAENAQRASISTASIAAALMPVPTTISGGSSQNAEDQKNNDDNNYYRQNSRHFLVLISVSPVIFI